MIQVSYIVLKRCKRSVLFYLKRFKLIRWIVNSFFICNSPCKIWNARSSAMPMALAILRLVKLGYSLTTLYYLNDLWWGCLGILVVLRVDRLQAQYDHVCFHQPEIQCCVLKVRTFNTILTIVRKFPLLLNLSKPRIKSQREIQFFHNLKNYAYKGGGNKLICNSVRTCGTINVWTMIH